MNQKELKRLSRGDLLEMMLSLSRENERLEKELHQAKHQLESRMIKVEESGSLAEAALSLNGVFQAAQAACDQYCLNVRTKADQLLAQAKKKLEVIKTRENEILTQANAQAEQIRLQANAQAEQILAKAREEAEQIRKEAAREWKAREREYAWIADIMENSEEP